MERISVAGLVGIFLLGCGGAPPVAEVAASPAPRPRAAIAPAPAPFMIPPPAPQAAPNPGPAGPALAPPPALLPAPASAPLPPPPPPLAASPSKPRSAQLKSGFYNPMPGGIFAGYQADTGLDIAGFRLPVHALASGTLDYSEAGHTLWTGKGDTPYTLRFELDTPIPWKGHMITHVYYGHLSKLEYTQREGEKPRRHVEGGELLGVSGMARGSPHLHIGLLLDGRTAQASWDSLLLADEIRLVLGGYRNGQRL